MEKQLPNNLEAEMGVLGSIIIDPDAIALVTDFLRTEDFYRDAHRIIFRAMLTLYARHEPSDYITLCDELERTNKLEEADGASYITSLINHVQTSGNVEYYGRIVQKKAENRELIHAAGMIARFAYSEDSDAVLKSEELIYQISQGKRIARVTSLRDAATRFMAKLDKLHENRLKGIVTGVPTGFKGLDNLLGGFQPSDLITIAARPAVGKTSLVLNVALRIIKDTARLGHKVMMFSLEMGEEQLMRRLMSMEATVNQTRLRNGDIEDEEWERIIGAMQTFDTERMWIDDTPAISLT